MLKRISPILLFLAVSPLAVYAQQTGASITGHVSDPSGASISGATIKLTSTTTGAVSQRVLIRMESINSRLY